MADALMAALRSGSALQSQCIVVVLDEFDLFAHATKQTLLYTLFDITQAGHAPLVVIGLTCRLDVMSLLEKRVLSRFSSRQIHLFMSQSFDEYVTMFKETIQLPDTFPYPEYRRAWNAHVDSLASSEGVRRELTQLYESNRDIRALHSLLTLPICRLCAERPFLTPMDFFEGYLSQSRDSKVAMLLGSSVLELCVLIAAHRVSVASFPDSFNFEMVFDCYKSFCLSPAHKGIEFYSKPIAYKAFDHLMALEIIQPVALSSAKRMETSSFHAVRLMLDRSQLIEVVDKYSALSAHIKTWAKTV
jgi:origin recognition complex subunit 4